MSDSLILVMVGALHLIALLNSSVIVHEILSSGSILIGMVAGALARILPIDIAFAKVTRR